MNKEIEIPNGYEARIDGNKVIIELKENEDEKIRTRLIALVESFGQGTYKNEMLAYLEKQKEQKPAEWSEEDERNYEYLYQIICNYINNPQIEYKEREKASKVLIPFWERLKSLRPQTHWKPSKDEITAIEVAMKFLLAHTSDEQLRKNVISVIEHLKLL